MDSTSDRQWVCQPGDEVFGADDHQLGKVKEVFPTYVVVEQGMLFHHDYFIPTSAINTCEGGKVYLNVTKDEALHRGWETVPETTPGEHTAGLAP